MIIKVLVSCVLLFSCYFLAIAIHDIYLDLYDIITGEDTRRK